MMNIKKQIFAALLMIMVGIHGSTPLWGQVEEVQGSTSLPIEGVHGSTPIRVVGYGFYDYHYATDGVGGGALMADWRVSQTFSLGAGVEYASSNRIAAKLGGMATLLTTSKGQRLTLENGYLWRHYPSLDQQEFTSALQLGWRARHADLHLGLCNRYSAALVQRTEGGMGTVFEPMNVMFAIEGWWNNHTQPQQWNVGVRWSNYNDFVVERVANWFFSAKGYYTLNDGTRLNAEVGVHPVGSLNLTASYDGWFMHLGAERKLGKKQ
ncbi:MAG: hypothetical protein IJK84_05190 [Bacteroidales bacterium]|nr:hypothetical protein [Bacteroidales bacterium]